MLPKCNSFNDFKLSYDNIDDDDDAVVVAVNDDDESNRGTMRLGLSPNLNTFNCVWLNNPLGTVPVKLLPSMLKVSVNEVKVDLYLNKRIKKLS